MTLLCISHQDSSAQIEHDLKGNAVKVFIVRHGETDYNRQRKMQGYQEIPLNDHGIQQASQLADRLLDEQIDRIICSDLRRAVMTGCIVAARIRAPMTYDAGLRERDPGDLVEGAYDDAPAFFTDPTYTPPNGESVPAFRQRVRDTFNRIAAAHADQAEEILVVAHGLVCHAFVDEFFGPAHSAGVGATNASMTIATYDGVEWQLDKPVCHAHLDVVSEGAGTGG